MKKIILLVASLFVIGCSNTQPDVVPTQKSNLTVGMVKTKVIEGKTTQNEILEIFGAPNLITTNSHGNEVWTYNKSSYGGKSSAGNVSGGILGTGAILGIFGGGASTAVTNTSTSSFDFIITFNKQGIVEKYKVISSSF